MEKRIFLYPADLMVLTGKTYITAYRNYRMLLDCLGKKRKGKLTIKDYCRLEDITEEEVRQALNLI